MGNPFSTAHPPKAIGGAARKSARDDATQRRIAKDKKRKHSPDPIDMAEHSYASDIFVQLRVW